MQMPRKPARWTRWTYIVGALLLLTVPGVAVAAGVTVNATIAGAVAANRTVTGNVTIDITDGSTLRSVTWRQISGAPATLTPQANHSVKIKLAPSWLYRGELIRILHEPPISADQLPPNVPVPPEPFPAGLQDRFQVVGLNPFALEEGGLVKVEVTAVTTSGTYTDEVDIQVALPFPVATGLNNVAVKQPVLLHGKLQDSYAWTLSRPAGSTARLTAANSQNPYFTPDVVGTYEARVSDLTTTPATPVVITIYAGTWRGVITGQDTNGRPVSDTACTNCHNGAIAPDNFTPWAETGHAEIFKDNLDTSTHYGSACFSCHMVGFDPKYTNNGADEAEGYQDFLNAGILNVPGDNWSTVLEEFPEVAKKANIQCENCHGPQVTEDDNSPAHGLDGVAVGNPRVSLSSDVCGSCHGEPTRHSRFQQWQLSGHANYELAIDEGTSASCARCHSGNGFLAWLPILLGEQPGDPLADLPTPLGWTKDEVHPQTCVTCHDPHANGTTTGVATNATVRISGDTPRLIAGFQATSVGSGAICMTCHNSRRGLRNDSTFTLADASRAPHPGVQADVLMGENAFLVNTGVRGRHSLIEDTCVNCHMERTPPPADLSYQLGGTNHTFYARPEICSQCHTGLDVTNLQHAFETVLEDLKGDIEAALLKLIGDQITAGYTVNVGTGASLRTITNMALVSGIELSEASGRQAIIVHFTDGTATGATSLANVKVVRPAPLTTVEIYALTDGKLAKAGWNYFLIHGDGSKGVHNPTWTLEVLDASRDAVGGGGTGTPRIRLSDYLK